MHMIHPPSRSRRDACSTWTAVDIYGMFYVLYDGIQQPWTLYLHVLPPFNGMELGGIPVHILLLASWLPYLCRSTIWHSYAGTRYMAGPWSNTKINKQSSLWEYKKLIAWDSIDQHALIILSSMECNGFRNWSSYVPPEKYLEKFLVG